MLPIVINHNSFIIEEAKASGIKDILIIEGKQKRSIEDHFDSAPGIRTKLSSKA